MAMRHTASHTAAHSWPATRRAPHPDRGVGQSKETRSIRRRCRRGQLSHPVEQHNRFCRLNRACGGSPVGMRRNPWVAQASAGAYGTAASHAVARSCKIANRAVHEGRHRWPASRAPPTAGSWSRRTSHGGWPWGPEWAGRGRWRQRWGLRRGRRRLRDLVALARSRHDL